MNIYFRENFRCLVSLCNIPLFRKSHSYFTFFISFLSVHPKGSPEPRRWTEWTTKVARADHLRGPIFLILSFTLIIVFYLFWLYCHFPNLAWVRRIWNYLSRLSAFMCPFYLNNSFPQLYVIYNLSNSHYLYTK